jgi:ferredoxin-NADP reductase
MAALSVECTVESYRQLTPTVFEICFKANQEFSFVGGQFISIIIPGAGPSGRDLRRAYSIASGPDEKPIELCVKLVEKGPGTNYLNRLRPGDVFKGMVPYGDFVYEEKPGTHVCFISTGTGIAPFRSILNAKSFHENPPLSSMLLLGVREEDEILYDDEFKNFKIGNSGKLHWAKCVSRPKDQDYTGFKGRVTDYLRALPEGTPFQSTEYYLCGGSAMIDEVKKILTEKGVEKTSIHQEVYYKEPKPSEPTS